MPPSPPYFVRRRRFLTTIAAGSFGLVGCLEGEGDGEADEPNSESDENDLPNGTGEQMGSPAPDEISIVLRNNTDAVETVRLSLSDDEGEVIEETVDVPPDGLVFVDPKLDERGEYELGATVDDRRTTRYPFTIDEYALERGSNVLVTVREDDVEIVIEE